ncbi:MAG: DUF433 domain-containing protein [Planctomycetota bacterium]
MNISLLLIVLQSQASPLPPELAAALTARRWASAQIEWETLPRPGTDDQPRHGRHTYVGDSAAYEVHFPKKPPFASGPDHGMFRGLFWHGGLLENVGSSLTANFFEDPRLGPAAGMDWRVVGMHASQRTAAAHDPFGLPEGATPTYTVSYGGNAGDGGDAVLVTRTYELDGRHHETRWWLDPERDWNVVRCEERRDGATRAAVTSELRRFGDVWFPGTVEYRNGAGNLLAAYRVRAVKVDEPGLPKKLTPAFIGVEPGTNITRRNRDGSDALVFLDGDELVSDKEFSRRARAGEIKRGPTFEREADDLHRVYLRFKALQPYTPSAWEQYVRAFILQYRLTQEQQNKAWAVHRACTERANKYLAARKDQIARLEQEAARKPEDAKTAARLSELRRPIEQIFARQLVPGLHKLLTPEQLRWASPVSQPARAPAGAAQSRRGDPMPAPECITTDPAVCHGRPVIRGTRVPVAVITGSLAGDTDEPLAQAG